MRSRCLKPAMARALKPAALCRIVISDLPMAWLDRFQASSNIYAMGLRGIATDFGCSTGALGLFEGYYLTSG